MRPSLAAALACVLGGAACGTRRVPVRFSSPMLATADTPARPLDGDPREPMPPEAIANRDRAIRVATAPKIREASAAAADAIAASPAAAPGARAALPGPHRIAAGEPLPRATTIDELRGLVGHRSDEGSIALARGWAAALGRSGEDSPAAPTEVAQPGDLLVFDHVTSDNEGDLVALVLARDPRGVTEFLYVGGGVIRRGFVDVTREATRVDRDGNVVNTYLRHGRRWPAKGSHYLSGELLSAIIHTR